VVETFLLVFWTVVLPVPFAPVGLIFAFKGAMVKNTRVGISLELTFVTHVEPLRLKKFFPVRLVLADLIRC